MRSGWVSARWEPQFWAIVLLGESAYAGRLVGIGLIVAGIVGLKLATPS